MFSLQTGNFTLDLLANVLIFIIGTAVLIKGSDWFVEVAAKLARRWGVSEIVIGLTLVSIGTSLPELASSVYAAFRGQGDFIIGNIVGSNITNISLILAIGIIAARKIPFERKMLTRDGVFMLIVYLFCALLVILQIRFPLMTQPASKRGIDYRGGIALLVLACIYLWVLFRQKKDHREETTQDGSPPKGNAWKDLGLFVLAFVMISAGAKGMVDPTVWGAQKLGISMLVISSTIVAFGTSVPELAVTLAGIIKKRHSIALGNIIGSNIFNILMIFGVTAIITPLPLDTGGIGLLNLILMGVTGLLLVLFMLAGKTILTAKQGIVLLLFYLAFVYCNYRAAFDANFLR